MTAGRFAIILIKLFTMIIVTAMFLFQWPELRYDFGPKTPLAITSSDQLAVSTFQQPTFAAVKGTPDLNRAVIFAKHGVRFTYFLLEEHGVKLVVRAPETVTEEWRSVTNHIGRLKPFAGMPFRRTVRAGFRQEFDVGIPEDALFLARDDVPHPGGWSIGAFIFAAVLWCVLFYFFWFYRMPPKPTAAATPPTA